MSKSKSNSHNNDSNKNTITNDLANVAMAIAFGSDTDNAAQYESNIPKLVITD